MMGMMITLNTHMFNKSVYTTGASSTNNPEGMTRGGFATNFGSGVAGTGVRGVEGTIVGCIFKALVSRLASSKEELATPENEVRILSSFQINIHPIIDRVPTGTLLSIQIYSYLIKQHYSKTGNFYMHEIISHFFKWFRIKFHGGNIIDTQLTQHKILCDSRSFLIPKWLYYKSSKFSCR